MERQTRTKATITYDQRLDVNLARVEKTRPQQLYAQQFSVLKNKPLASTGSWQAVAA